MSDEHERDTAADVIDDVIDSARDEGASDATLAELRARLQAVEDRQVASTAPSAPVDLSPLAAAIAALGSQFEGFGSRIDALESRQASASVEHETETDTEDDGEIAPQIDIKQASTAAVKSERAPARGHLMFRRVGGSRR